MRPTIPTMAATAFAFAAGAASAQTGAEMAGQCAGCHGPEGVSVEDTIPNLAAQKEAYLAAQLRAFRAGDRENELMNAIASQLSDEDIDGLAAHFAGLPGAEPGVTGESPEGLAGQLLEFPEDYRDSFVQYFTVNFDDRGQVRHYWTNPETLEAMAAGDTTPDGSFVLVEIFKAKTDDAGEPVKGEDGFFEEGELSAFTAMQKKAGWGEDVPEILRNDDWRYAVFSADGETRQTNEGRCLACHKPLDDEDYLFRYDELKAAAEKG